MLKLPRNDMYDAVQGVTQHLGRLGATYSAHLQELEREAAGYETYTLGPPLPLSTSDKEDAQRLYTMSENALVRYSSEKALDMGVVISGARVTSANQQALTKRHFEDPRTGTCDAAGVILIPDFFKGIALNAPACHKFGIMPMPTPETTSRSKATAPEEISGISSSPTPSADTEKPRDIFATSRHVSLCSKEGMFPISAMCTTIAQFYGRHSPSHSHSFWRANVDGCRHH